LPLFALPFQRRIVRWLTGRHTMLNRASGALLIAIGVFGILTELLPQVWSGFYLAFWQQVIYWILAALVTLIVAYAARPQNDQASLA
jgi:hypothetical protein